jgi:hypothetical protein
MQLTGPHYTSVYVDQKQMQCKKQYVQDCKLTYVISNDEENIAGTTITLEPGEAVTFVFQGSLKPLSPDVDVKDLALAVHDENLISCGLDVPPLKVDITFWYQQVFAEDDKKWSNQSGRTQQVTHTIQSRYTVQDAEVPCEYELNVFATRLEAESRRCCLIHQPMYNQGRFLYYAHDLDRIVCPPYYRSPYSNIKTPYTVTCDCCL